MEQFCFWSPDALAPALDAAPVMQQLRTCDFHGKEMIHEEKKQGKNL